MKLKCFNWYSAMMHGTVVAFGLLAMFLTLDNQRLKERLNRASVAAAGGPEVETLLPPLPVADFDGMVSTLSYDQPEKDSIVLFFTTTCGGACKSNFGNWLDLYERFSDRYEFVAVGLDDAEATRTYAEENELPFRIVIPTERRDFQLAYKIFSVPQTLVVGNDGRVKDVQPGVLPASFPDRLG